ncbi:processed acidic surface protein [Radiobacillus kanasensis]|uniref:processed acidic surface protein n=1 Tax=Radiobacillus kanasensis TaxID=2844358 RepID=UPI001E2845F9|nr:processed acidic surface protein [Radiobacillus kanasensis]UFT99722.1 processed acidic surface protein [Radiobacillus kanasensis]
MKKFVSFLVVGLFLVQVMLPTIAKAAPNETELNEYLTTLGWTKTQLETYLLDEYDSTLADFSTMEELELFLGEIVTPETLQALLADYGLTEVEFNQVLADNGLTINDFKFIDDVDWFLMEQGYVSGSYEELLTVISDLFGLSDTEIEKLTAHLDSIAVDADFEKKLMEISAQLESMSSFESASDLTEQQKQDFVNAWNELLSLFEVQANYYLDKDGVTTPVTMAQLVEMDDTDGASLVIEIFDLDGNFLADLVLTADMFGSDLIEEVTSAPSTPVTKTEDGGKLPNTATSNANWILFGLVLVGAGLFVSRKRVMSDK